MLYLLLRVTTSDFFSPSEYGTVPTLLHLYTDRRLMLLALIAKTMKNNVNVYCRKKTDRLRQRETKRKKQMERKRKRERQKGRDYLVVD